MTPRMSVLMISPQFSPIVGGYERAAERLSDALGRRGACVTVVTERRDRSWPRTEDRATFTVQRLWCIYARRLHLVSALAALCMFLLRRGSKYDVLHVHQYGYHAAAAVVLGRVLGRPVVLKITNTAAEGISEILRRQPFGTGLLYGLHRRVDACIATTYSARVEAMEFGIPESRIFVVPNGVDTGSFAPASAEDQAGIRARLGLKPGPVVLFCGRLAAEKNISGLLTAWRHVARTCANAQLVLVGDGPEREHVEASISADPLCRGICVVGEQKAVVPWYQAADLFVLSSDHEGLSNSLLEAMSCGVPVVSTRVSGSTEILGEVDAGELVEVGDMAALGAGIQRLIMDPIRRAACGERARQYSVNHFSIDAVAAATEDVYRFSRQRQKG